LVVDRTGRHRLPRPTQMRCCCLVLAWSNRHDSSSVPRLPPERFARRTDLPPCRSSASSSAHGPRLRSRRATCQTRSSCLAAQHPASPQGEIRLPTPVASVWTAPGCPCRSRPISFLIHFAPPSSGARRVYQTRLPRSSARFRHRSGSAPPESNATVSLPHSTSPFKPGSGRECATPCTRATQQSQPNSWQIVCISLSSFHTVDGLDACLQSSEVI
jgi:hypothetical protein